MEPQESHSEPVQEERVNRELFTLYELSATIIQTINLAEFLQTLIERTGQIMQVRSGSIVMLDPDGLLRIKAFFGFKEEHANGYVLRPNEGRGGRIFTSGKSQMFVTSRDAQSHSFHAITQQEQIEFTIGAPMIGSEGQVTGVLFVNDKISSQPFDEKDLKILENFANLAAIAVEKKIQLEELNRQKERYQKLYEELETSHTELNAANERLRESNKLKDEVLSICAHDVRSPLTSITSYAELLLSSDNLSEKQQRYVAHIHRSSEKINNLVQNLLIRARYLESNEPLRLESVSLGRLGREALQQIEDRLSSKSIQSRVIDNWHKRICADRFKLAQVLDNLVDNASKFTPEAGTITIEILPFTEETTWVEVVVSNSGEGIPPDALPHLFARYYQVAHKQSKGGYGLGLAICKQNVELHGGNIRAESTLNEKTSFRFTIPTGSPSLLLLSDDNHLKQEILHLLPNDSWRYNHVEDAKNCINQVTTELPAVLVIDASVNNLDTNTLVEQIRKEYDHFRLPIYLIKGSKNNNDVAPFVKILTEPLTTEHFTLALID